MDAVTNGMVVAGAGALTWAGLGWVRVRRSARLLALAKRVTGRHARLLSVKQKQLVAHDGYGNYRLEPWIAHVDYFIEQVILREAEAGGLRVDGVRPGTSAWAALRRTLLSTVNAQDLAAAGAITEAEILSGEHYETLCRDLLRAAGWTVSTTPTTGDQGADLIAETRGRRLVIQCKFYSRPVGNKAVQEAVAARAFHAGDEAAVVSNAAFTRAARDLARVNAVLLLHHDQLADLAASSRQSESRRRG